jgi:hypothetical protein
VSKNSTQAALRLESCNQPLKYGCEETHLRPV